MESLITIEYVRLQIMPLKVDEFTYAEGIWWNIQYLDKDMSKETKTQKT